VLGYSTQQADALAELSGQVGRGTRDAGQWSTVDGQQSTVDRRPSTVDYQPSTVDRIATSLHDLPRHRSIHVGGFVLTREPLSTVVPIEPASMPDRTIIQWEKDDLDPVGLVKIDLLGLGMLTALQECFHTIRRTRGVSLDLAAIPHGDMAVYDDLCRADTVGVFQVESRAQMNTLPRLKPRCFYDLVVEVALIRPGPIQGDMVHPYLRRRAGKEAVTYPHPALEPILKRTLGVPLFQEQGMQVAITVAGFTPGEADTLRRAMGHKRSRERMAAICEKLIEGMQRNGIPEATAQKIFNQINAFADYGFPESHAASFAILVYASAYLRHYYAPEYLAAMLNAQPMGFYSPGTLTEDARRHGVEVRGVDLIRSSWNSTMEPGEQGPVVRLGLRTVRGLGARAREILEAGAAEHAYTSVADVVQAGLDRRTLRALAEAGAFDGMFPDQPVASRRRSALWAVLAVERGAAGPLAPPVESPRPARLPPMSRVELTEADYRMTGLSLAGHPMSHLREWLTRNGIPSAADVLEGAGRGTRDAGPARSSCDAPFHLAHDSRLTTHAPRPASVVVAGLVICRQRPHTARGFVFVTLEDETGMLNVVIPPTVFEKQRLLIARSPLLMVRGELQVEGLVVNVKAEECEAIDAEAGKHAKSHDFH
jgi:error-prone DNA polymerase